MSAQVHSTQITASSAEAVLLHAGLYTGASLIRLPEGLQPDFGPTTLDPRHGFAAVGAVPWVVNYNVLVHTEDMQACRSIAKAISTKGGGLPSVEAMALQHDKGKLFWCDTQSYESLQMFSLFLAIPTLHQALALRKPKDVTQLAMQNVADGCIMDSPDHCMQRHRS